MFKKILTILSLIAVIATAICCPVAAEERQGLLLYFDFRTIVL